MKLISLKCDYCGADLTVSEDYKIITCECCGNNILIDDDIERHEIIIKNEYQPPDITREDTSKKVLWIRIGYVLSGILLIPLVYLMCMLFQFIIGTSMISENMWIYAVAVLIAECKLIDSYKRHYLG